MNVLAEEKISKINETTQNNKSKQPLRNSSSLKSRQETKTIKKDDSVATNSTNSLFLMHFNPNKKNKKVTFKKEFEDIVLIQNYKEFYSSNLDSKGDEEKINDENLQSKSEEDNNEVIEELNKKFNHKEMKNNCSVCCNIY